MKHSLNLMHISGLKLKEMGLCFLLYLFIFLLKLFLNLQSVISFSFPF